MPLKAQSSLPEGCSDALTPTVRATEPPKRTILCPPGVGGGEGRAALQVVGVPVGKSGRRPVWQTVALLRSYVAKTKSAVPNSLVDTITFIIYGSL